MNRIQSQVLKTFSLLALIVVGFSFTYPLLYGSFTFNRTWPLKRSELISKKIQSLSSKEEINIILGSCGAESSLRADVMTKLTGKPWFNFSLRGALPSFQERLLQKLINEKSKIGKVILVLEPIDLTIEQENASKKFETSDFDRRLFSYADVLKENTTWKDKLDLIFIKAVYSDILPWFFTKSVLMEFSRKGFEDIKNFRALTIAKEFEDISPWDDQTRGDITFNAPSSSDLLKSYRTRLFGSDYEKYLRYAEHLEGRKTLKPSLNLLNAYLKIVNSLQRYSKEVIIVFPPEYHRLYAEDKERTIKTQIFTDFFISKNLKTYVGLQTQFNAKDAFLDFNHLSYSAAEEFTTKIVHETGILK